MTSFEDYFSDDRILHYVCKCRAKVAKRRNRQQLVYNVSGNVAAIPRNLATEEELLTTTMRWRSPEKHLLTQVKAELNEADELTCEQRRRPLQMNRRRRWLI